MATAERTFSFRAPSELRQRLDRAERAYLRLADDPAIAAHVSRELEIRLQRRLRDVPPRDTQSRVLRSVVEAFVEATEAVEHDEALVDELRAFDRADRSGATDRHALLHRSLPPSDT